MYLKRDRKELASGETTYVMLAHNIWEGSGQEDGQTRPVVLYSFGTESELDMEFVEDVQAMAQRVFDRRISKGESVQEALSAVRQNLGLVKQPLKLLCSKELGMRLVLQKAWEDLGIGAALRGYGDEHAITFPFERIVFGMVLNRLVDPMSKMACNDWLKDAAYFPEGEDWQVHHFYRAMDLLHMHWKELDEVLCDSMSARIPEALRGVWLVDTTSIYFESTRTDEDLAELKEAHAQALRDGTPPPKASLPAVVNEPAFRMRGHSKDGHSGDPQVVLASCVALNGQILRHRIYSGNTNDLTIAKDLIESIPKPKDGILLWASDGGMASSELLAMLDLGGWMRLTAESLTKTTFAKERVLPYVERLEDFVSHPEKPKFRYLELMFGADEVEMLWPEKWFLTCNDHDRERQLKLLEKNLTRIKETLQRQGEEPHHKEICRLAAHKSLGRFLRAVSGSKEHYELNEDAVQLAIRTAGIRLYRTTLTEWPAHELHDTYQLLQTVEKNHRELKTPLRLRPCYHRVDERIEAHVMINILALNCLRHLEGLSGNSAAELRKLVQPVKAVQMTQGGGSWWQAPETTAEFKTLLTKIGARQLPETWSHWSEIIQPRSSRKPA